MRDQENKVSWGPCFCDAGGKERCHRKGSKVKEESEKQREKKERQCDLKGMKKYCRQKCSLCQGDLPKKTPLNQVSIVNTVE